MKYQSKIESLIEATVNTIVGFTITITVLPLINYICGIKMSGGQMTLSTALFTVISILRGYVVRRFFNNFYGIKSLLRKLILEWKQ